MSLLPDINIPLSTAELTLATIAIIMAIANILRRIFGSFFGGPVGSDNVFRDAAEDTIDDLNNLRRDVEAGIQRVLTVAPQEYSGLIFTWVTEIAKIYAMQNDLWNRFKGRNLLGATFFGGWTNSVLQKDHLGQMQKMTAEWLNQFRLNVDATFAAVRRRFEEIEGGEGVGDQLRDLDARIDQLEELMGPRMQQLIAAVANLNALAQLLNRQIGDILAGRQGLSDPQTRQSLDTLRRQLEAIRAQVQRMPTNWSNATLAAAFLALNTQLRALQQGLDRLNDQIEEADLPGMQREIDRMGRQLLLLPGIQAAIERLRQQAIDIVGRQLPAIRAALQAGLAGLQRQIDAINQKLRDYGLQNLPALLAAWTLWELRWPGERGRIIREACDCAARELPPKVRDIVDCRYLLQTLVTCCESDDPELRALWARFKECAQPTAPEDVALEKLPFMYATFQQITRQQG